MKTQSTDMHRAQTKHKAQTCTEHKQGVSLCFGFSVSVFCLCFGFCVLGSNFAQADNTQPHIKRVGPNLVPNSTIPNASNWYYFGPNSPYDNLHAPEYDNTVSHTADGSGSIKLPGAYNYSRTMGKFGIPVTPGKTYSLSAYMKTDSWPPSLVGLSLYVSDQYGGWYANIFQGSASSNSRSNKWEETSSTWVIPAGAQYVGISMHVGTGPGSGNIWIDDLYLGEGIGFEQPPTSKKPFNGSCVRVDELGNIEINKNGTWTPFYPLCIFGDLNRPNAEQFYSDQGFNCDIWMSTAGSVNAAKQAVSDFNPDGMMSGFQIAQYIGNNLQTGDRGWAYGDLNDLTTQINGVKDAGLMDSILWYYWDNENSFQEWDVPKAVTDKIKELDVDQNGQRMHPIYALQGTFGVARMYRDTDGESFTDIVGAYAGMENTGGAARAGAFPVLQNIEGQDNPVVMNQINLGIPNIRVSIYEGLAHGLKAIAIYRDDYMGVEYPRIETFSWWNDIPNIRREIDQLMPLIRQPHWTDWQLASSNSSMDYGTRDYLGEGYIIAINPTASVITTTFTMSELPYTASSVKDYFTANTVTTVANQSFRVTLPALETAVYRIVRDGSVFYGDVNNDSQVSAYDAALVAQAVVGSITFDTNQTQAADVSGDGQVSAYDAALIAQYAVGLIEKFPVEE